MAQYALDILPPGAADSYEEYLKAVKDGMEQLTEAVQRIADELDDHDENSETRGLQEVLEQLAGYAATTADSARETTLDLLGKLEEKNEVVGSRRQSEYIDQIRQAAGQLEELNPYRGCELSGDLPLTEEEKETIQEGLRDDLPAEWEEITDQLKEKAVELAEENVQNELSGVYLLLSDKMTELLSKMTETVESVGISLDERMDSVRDRKRQMEQAAEDNFQEMMNQSQQRLEEARDKLTRLVF